MRARANLLSLLLLAALSVAFFWKLALTNLIMVGVDIFTYFYPYRFAINQAIQQRHVPLWNPYLFMGVPLLANAQAGMLYPLNWPFAWLTAPEAINASIVLHVFIAAAGTFGFARRVLGIGWHGALLSACVFAFGGYAGSLVEHVNQLQAAAWFPYLLWCADGLRRTRPLRAMLAGSVVLALQLLAGHAQVTYISLSGVGLWLLASVVAEMLNGKDVSSPIRLRAFWQGIIRRLLKLTPALAGLVVLGVGLSAAQLVPMLELSRLSIRGSGMTYREAVAFSLPPKQLLEAFLPAYGLGDTLFSEFVSFIGVIAFELASLGLARWWSKKTALLVLLIAGLALAFGLYDPLYYVLFKVVPGFGLFRVPARWLFLFAFAVAGFAGIGLEEAAERVSIRQLLWVRRRAGLTVVIATAMLAAAVVLRWVDIPPLVVMGAWIAAGIGMLIIIGFPMSPALRRSALLAAVLVELFAATRWLPYNQPTAPEAYSSLRPAIAFLLSEDHAQPWRVLSYSDLNWDPGDLNDIRTMFGSQLSDESIYQYTVAAKTKEIVGPNLAMRYGLQSIDGYDGGILPLARFVGLQSLFLTPAQVNPDGRLRERLRAVPPGRWLDLFDVRYLTADKIFDVWVDGIYYDLGLGVTLDSTQREPRTFDAPTDFRTTAIGVVSYLQGAAALPNDMPVAELTATTTEGRVYTYTLRAGRETAEGAYASTRPAHAEARAVHTLRDNPSANEYHALLKLDAPADVASISLRSLLTTGSLTVHGISLVDPANGTGKPLTFAADGHFELVHSGDVKIYKVLETSGRAVVVHRSTVEPDDGRALQRMAETAFDPRREIVLADGRAMDAPAPPTTATVTSYAAEQIVLETQDSAEGYLLLKDSWYPGWRAWVDGQPAAIERADTYFRAVYLPAGPHHVELRYESDSVSLGAAITALTALLMAGIALAGDWKSRQEGVHSTHANRPPTWTGS